MKLLRTLVLFSFALTCCLIAANAKSLVKTVSGKNFDLVLPDGYCVPSLDNAGEAYFVNFLTKLMSNSGNKLVQTGVDCYELQGRHENASAAIFKYVVYYYPTTTENEVLNGDRAAQRSALCNSLRESGDEAVKDVPQEVAKAAKEMKNNAAMTSTKVLGVLAEDAHGCYVGILVGINDGAHSYMINVTMVSTVIHGRSLYLSLYSKYESPEASARSLQLAKTTAVAMDSKNPD